MWDVEYTDEFEQWWETLTEQEQISIAASVELLETFGPNLKFPHSSGIHGTQKYDHLRELRTQHQGRPLRTLYAFDPRRTAILLIAGDKLAMTVGMRSISLLQSVYMMIILIN